MLFFSLTVAGFLYDLRLSQHLGFFLLYHYFSARYERPPLHFYLPLCTPACLTVLSVDLLGWTAFPFSLFFCGTLPIFFFFFFINRCVGCFLFRLILVYQEFANPVHSAFSILSLSHTHYMVLSLHRTQFLRSLRHYSRAFIGSPPAPYFRCHWTPALDPSEPSGRILFLFFSLFSAPCRGGAENRPTLSRLLQ